MYLYTKVTGEICMNKFIVDGRYAELLNYYGIRVEEALRKAELPGDTFCHKAPVMKEEAYYRFMDAAGALIIDPQIPVQIACTDQIESFSPPIFASYCSKNGNVCIERLARYKKLIGPMVFQVQKENGHTEVVLTTETAKYELPQFLVETEFVFLVGIIRKATKETITPIAVNMKKPVTDTAFSNFLGCTAVPAEHDGIVFLDSDLEIPFISYNESMWDYFEPELSRRLAELDIDESTSARVRCALTELIPGGACTVEDVAAKMGMSKRTLQRKLREEQTTFQKQLNNTREMLALHYIRNTDISTNDIAYLLGYQELNSFLRAFAVWTGMSVTEYKKRI